DAIRAAMLVQRGGPGDLESASERAERAVEAEPKLLMPYAVKLGVAMARSQWAVAVATLNAVESNLGMTLSEDDLRGLPNAAGFFATPDYKQWRSRQP